MSTSPVFEWVCSELVERSSTDMPQIRDLLRLALKNAGLEPRTLGQEQAAVVLERLLWPELNLRRVPNAATICHTIAEKLRAASFADTGPESAESAFARLGRK